VNYSDEWRSSDEILDSAKEALTFFADFIPVYDQAAALAGRGRYRGISMANDIQRPYDELRGIDFSMLRADAEHLRSAIDSAENHQHNLDRYWGSLSGAAPTTTGSTGWRPVSCRARTTPPARSPVRCGPFRTP
jgi:hypothetical protein